MVQIGGTYTALVTPFRDGRLDESALAALVDRQVNAGVTGVVPCGTTGESATLTDDEQRRLIEFVVQRVNGKCQVIAGTGSNDTAHTIELTRSAARAGVDGALVVTPYYNTPTQDGLFQHYASIAEACDLPIILYNVPHRCSVDLANDTALRLADEFSSIVAIKDASRNVERVSPLTRLGGLIVLSGDDALTLPMMAQGASGVISVVANLVPSWTVELVEAALAGRFDRADMIHRRIRDLTDTFSRVGPNPVPIKTAMAIIGIMSEEFRLPLTPLNHDAKRAIESTLVRHELA